MRKCLVLALCFVSGVTSIYSQNYSGLLNKRLPRVNDPSFYLESKLGNLLGGKLEGQIDSVVVTWDTEITLKVRVYYSNFINGFFMVNVLNAGKARPFEVGTGKFSQAAQPSPAECTLQLKPNLPKGTKFQTPYLRIDIAKQENQTGNVNVYTLNKKWNSEQEAQNVIIPVTMVPVGKAALLTNEVKDVMPIKTIKFDPGVLYYKPNTIKTQKLGGNSLPRIDFSSISMPEDISGTWLNINSGTNGITKLIVTNNNSIQVFGKCSPQDCDWGKTSLISLGGNNFKAIFNSSYVINTLNISYVGGQLNLNESDYYKVGGATKTYSYSFKKNITMLYAKANVYSLSQLTLMTPVNPTAQPDNIPKGPDKNFPISLIDGISADVDFKRPQDISNINLNAFLDINQKSGIVYILPADYHLKWEPATKPEKGYDFFITYGKQGTTITDEGTDAPVRMSGTLTTDISTREIEFVKTLLKASFPGFTNVKYLPLRENPQFTFQNTLGAQYNIPQSKITVETSTDLTSDIRVAWQTDADTKEFIQTALMSREGIAASVILKPDDENIVDQQIPAMINLADIRTLGKINIEPNTWRNQFWRNTTPYPLKLNYLHVLKKENTGTTPIIYSWAMGDAVIPSQGQAMFNSNIVPAWLDNMESVIMWIDYSVMDCNECDQKVMNAVTGNVNPSNAQQVKFTIPPAVFDSLGASYFMITVRSLQADAQGQELRELDALKVTKDPEKVFSAGPLYVPSGGKLDFEYKITVASTDGEFYQSNTWIKGNSKDMLLGKNALRTIFKGIIPGIN
ncbi:MAG TPA: hypothetical protein VLJ68_06365 [Chitinophagaceae bacterium]|nr:hypothetical protein [Chitinophagaceae bacterium]